MKIEIKDVGEIVNYSDLLQLSPNEYPVVSVYNKKLGAYEPKTVYRKYVSYGKSPEFEDTGKSYMFNNKSKDMPEVILELLSWAKDIDPRYNNVYVNWYKDGNDHIEPHSDCIKSLAQDSNILIYNLNEGKFKRTFKIENKFFREDSLEIPLLHGRLIKLDAVEQTQYRHWVPTENTSEGRISVTFRMVI